MAVILVTAGCAVGAAALSPLLVRLADATAHRNAVTTTPVRLALTVALGGFGAAAGARLEISTRLGWFPSWSWPALPRW